MPPDRSALVLGPALAAWIGEALAGQQVACTAVLTGGYRNRNTLIRTAAGQQFVLRQYLQPDGRRAAAVEAALLARVAGRVPVAEVVAADPAGTSAGEPALLCRFSPGVMLTDALASRPALATELGRSVGRTLAAIGTVTFGAPGTITGASLRTSDEGVPGTLPEFVAQCLLSGPAQHVLSGAEQAAIARLAEACQPCADSVPAACQLVHSDFNGKNLLVGKQARAWTVTAVLDWEFAFSGSPLFDVGNMLRFPDDLPPGYEEAFTSGFTEGGGRLPDGWRAASRALDLYALADLLTRPADHRYFGRALQAIRRQLAAS
jgi:aminoglycoside phosphotransferase (APT) family kinase protein